MIENSVTIAKLFEDFYLIPRFQRPYSWGEQNVAHLIEDIMNSDDGYFIGSTIHYKSEKDLAVIDGQQRLTTLALIICSLRDKYKEIDESFAFDIQKQYIRKRDMRPGVSSSSLSYKINNEACDPETQRYFRETILSFSGEGGGGDHSSLFKYNISSTPPTEEAKLLFKNKKFIDNYIMNEMTHKGDEDILGETPEERLHSIYNKVLGATVFVITAESFNEGYAIFKTLNARGMDLSILDLIKSRIFQLLQNDGGYDNPSRIWHEIESNLEEVQNKLPRANVFDTFLFDYWITRHGYGLNKKNMFDRFDEFLNAGTQENSENRALFLLKDLRYNSELYKLIFVGGEQTSRSKKIIDAKLRGLRLFGIFQYSSLMLVALQKYYSSEYKSKVDGVRVNQVVKQEHVLKLIEILEKFHLQYNSLTKSPGNRITTTYPSYANKLNKAKSNTEIPGILKNLRDQLKEIQPAEEMLKNGFNKLEYKSTGPNASQKARLADLTARFILEKIYLLNPEWGNFGMEISRLSIDHLTPRSEIVNYRDVYKMGNLIFLPEQINNKMLSIGFAEKKQFLENEGLWEILPHDVKSKTEWSNQDIINRTESMFHYVSEYVKLENIEFEDIR